MREATSVPSPTYQWTWSSTSGRTCGRCARPPPCPHRRTNGHGQVHQVELVVDARGHLRALTDVPMDMVKYIRSNLWSMREATSVPSPTYQWTWSSTSGRTCGRC